MSQSKCHPRLPLHQLELVLTPAALRGEIPSLGGECSFPNGTVLFQVLQNKSNLQTFSQDPK